MNNKGLATLLAETAELLNEGALFNKKKKEPKVDFLVKYNNPKSWNKIKNKIAWYEFTSKEFNTYPYEWRKLLGEYNKEIDAIITTIIRSKDLEKDSVKIFVKLGVIKTKYSNKINNLIKEIDGNTEWNKSMSFMNDIELFINDLHDPKLCYMYLIESNKDIHEKAKENAIVRKIDSEISEITEIFYSEVITKICHAIKIAHE